MPLRPQDEPTTPTLLRSADQVVVALLVTVGLAALGLWCVRQGWLEGRMVDIEQSQPTRVEFLVDINEADWPELSELPNIGETLARRIVEYRQANGPFRDLNELRRVQGIGPKTLESMKPHLIPVADLETVAGP
jgi:competence protein ComEA